MPRPTELLFPAGNGKNYKREGPFTRLSHLQSVVIIGANGSGKTRFGYAIEEINQVANAAVGHSIQRIAAQRALTVKKSHVPLPRDEAEKLWYVGYKSAGERNIAAHRQNGRWQGNPYTSLLDDFDALLQFVFALSRERDHAFSRAHREGRPMQEQPEAPADRVEKLWNKLFPHRRIKFEESKITAEVIRKRSEEYEATEAENWAPQETISYNASDMSDGERVALYLMAQAFVAPEGTVLIIDEPEIHLHKSIRDAIFDELESERSDCLFIYLTHDVEFAAARTGATRIWLKKYTGTGWFWEEVSDAEGVPAALVTELLGSRRPVLFVEGERESIDTLIFTRVYDDRYVVPVGSCNRVIQLTRALRAGEAEQLHRLDAQGIIDRDRLTEEEITGRAEGCVHVLDVAEADNLLLLPGVIRFIAERLDHDPEEKLDRVVSAVVELVRGDLGRQVGMHVHHRIRREITQSLGKAKMSVDDVKRDVSGLTSAVDVDLIWEDVETSFDEALNYRDYEALLRLANYKGLVPQIAPILGLSKDDKQGKNGLESYVRRAMQRGEALELEKVFRKSLPAL